MLGASLDPEVRVQSIPREVGAVVRESKDLSLAAYQRSETRVLSAPEEVRRPELGENLEEPVGRSAPTVVELEVLGLDDGDADGAARGSDPSASASCGSSTTTSADWKTPSS
jgi:hypothetical protein